MKKRVRSKNLSNEAIETIVQLLDGWASKLTWDHLISAIDFRIEQHYTRQALSSHPQIKSAYDDTKKRLSRLNTENLAKKKPQQDDSLLLKIKDLETDNIKLKKENKELLEQIARWVYNAYRLDITPNELDKPLAL